MKRTLLALALGLTLLPLGGCLPVMATGVGVGVMMAEDRRTSGIYVEDEGIELKTTNRIREDLRNAKVHVNATSFNRRVLLTGEVPDAATRAQVVEIAKGVPNVREVQDETQVAGVSSFVARTNDGYLSAKVKARLLDDKRFNAFHIKVVTEAGTVFLMGLVKPSEGEAAAEVAARTNGVTRVIKYFEYID